MDQIYERSLVDGCFRQGEIVSGLVVYQIKPPTGDSPDQRPYDAITHPVAIVLSQDCDLKQDFDARASNAPGTLPHILFAEVVTFGEVKQASGGRDIWKRIHQNKDDRYQFLAEIPRECDLAGKGLESLCIDFKRYFSVPTDQLLAEKPQRRSRLSTPYAEHLSVRFASYFARVGLPLDHHNFKPAEARALPGDTMAADEPTSRPTAAS